MCWRSASSRVEIAEAEEAEEFKEVKEAKEEEESVPGLRLEMAVDFNSLTGTRKFSAGGEENGRARGDFQVRARCRARR